MHRRRFAGGEGEQVQRLRPEAQPGGARLADHPGQRHVGQRVVGIAAADIGVHAGEPDLAQPVRRHLAASGHLPLGDLVPEQRVEGVALVVQRQGLPRLGHLGERRKSGIDSGQTHLSMPRVSSAIGVP